MAPFEGSTLICTVFNHIIGNLFIFNFLSDSRFHHKFAMVLFNMIYKFLREKEAEAIEEKQWFFDEAVTGSNIQECGTFRRALSYRIEKEIVPILSHVISKIDVSCNLDLLTDKYEWKKELWLEFFSSEEFFDLEEVRRTQVRPQKKVVFDFICKFPFSLAVRDKMTSITEAHHNDGMFSSLLIFSPSTRTGCIEKWAAFVCFKLLTINPMLLRATTN